MSWFFLLLVILAFHFVVTTLSDQQQILSHQQQLVQQVEQAEVHIISGVPDPLRVRCQSKEDDIGMHTLNNGQEFFWRFRPLVSGHTLFFCHFYWGSKDKSFDVYQTQIISDCLTLGKIFPHCYWVARPDGFYISNDNKTWKKKVDWGG